MPTNPLNRLVSQLTAAAASDADLLDRFVRDRDESAFEALLRRHGGMVFGVCRRVLGHQHDAEDAFQATFLVLARNAATVRQRSRLGNYLYGVARRTALESKKATTRRLAKEATVARPELQDNGGGELRAILDDELARLPDKYREVIVLCDLEGRGPKKVAEQMGCPEGTVKNRLFRARAMLGKRLARHGLASAGIVVAAEQAGTAAVPVSLIHATVKAAIAYTAGKTIATAVVTASVATLTEGVVKAMLLTKLKTGAAVLLLTAGIFGAGIGGVDLVYQTRAADKNEVQKRKQIKNGVEQNENKPGQPKDEDNVLRLRHAELQYKLAQAEFCVGSA